MQDAEVEVDDPLIFLVARVRRVWHVRRHGHRRSCARFGTRDDAVHFAAELVARHPAGGSVVIRDGPERTDTLVLRAGELGAVPPPPPTTLGPAAPATTGQVHVVHHPRPSPSRRLPAW